MLPDEPCASQTWEHYTGSYEHDIQLHSIASNYLDPATHLCDTAQLAFSPEPTTFSMNGQIPPKEFSSNMHYLDGAGLNFAPSPAENNSVGYPESSQRTSQQLGLYLGPSMEPILGTQQTHELLHASNADRASQPEASLSSSTSAGYAAQYTAPPLSWTSSYDPPMDPGYPHDPSHVRIPTPAGNSLFFHDSSALDGSITSLRFQMTHDFTQPAVPLDAMTPSNIMPYARFPSTAASPNPPNSASAAVNDVSSPTIGRHDAADYFDTITEAAMRSLTLDRDVMAASSSIHHCKPELPSPLDLSVRNSGGSASHPWATHSHGSGSGIRREDSAGSEDTGAVRTPPRRPKKRSKMHECEICHKKFPRPSGLRTHMNTHTDSKPFPCTFSGCSKRFAVRSNAKRHLRTHGIIPGPPDSAPLPYVVDFSAPIVAQDPMSDAHEAGQSQLARVQPRLQWIPASLASRTNVASLRSRRSPSEALSASGSDEASDVTDDGFDDFGALRGRDNEDGLLEQVLSIPLPPVIPSTCEEDGEHYEERNSYAEAGLYPYHSSQFRNLPGPNVLPQVSSH
ncbi:hypothetical protein HGRIS_011319 [Hohenbuehelia grisea]|uniref:C2H2-type domain-containing protein n=1 Tax=Hohenbuehelia grisea TaxID=104357 RepID=A0ABR3JVT2_9AGAR